MGLKNDHEFFSPFTDNPAGSADAGAEAGAEFGDTTFGAGADGTRTPTEHGLDEVQFVDFGQDDAGGLDVLSPAPNAVGKAPGSGK